MIFTENEKRMYKVMEALYDSGIPISFKGSMVLKAVLQELGYIENIRGTKDIDGNWYSNDILKTDDIEKSINKVFSEKGLKYYAKSFREHSTNKSAGINVFNTINDEILFSMDIDVNRPRQQTKIYTVNDVNFSGIIPEQIIADKLLVVSSNKVFRRIKDVIDLYYLSKVVYFEKKNILLIINNNQRVLGDFKDFLYSKENLHHAYDKFSFPGRVEKPDFQDLYNIVTDYIHEFLPIRNKNIAAASTIEELKIQYPVLYNNNKLRIDEIKFLGEYYYKLGVLLGKDSLSMKDIDRMIIKEMINDGHPKARINTLFININERRNLLPSQYSPIKEMLGEQQIMELQKTIKKLYKNNKVMTQKLI